MTAARKRCRRLAGIALAVFAAGGVVGFIGFDEFFMPLTLIGSLCMWWASYWDGWADATKTANAAPSNLEARK